ncbi:hypothetical protein D3C71_1825450 [compost metagenome]
MRSGGKHLLAEQLCEGGIAKIEESSDRDDRTEDLEAEPEAVDEIGCDLLQSLIAMRKQSDEDQDEHCRSAD